MEKWLVPTQLTLSQRQLLHSVSPVELYPNPSPAMSSHRVFSRLYSKAETELSWFVLSVGCSVLSVVCSPASVPVEAPAVLASLHLLYQGKCQRGRKGSSGSFRSV